MPDKIVKRFIESVTLTGDDPTFSILKSHLLFEDALRTFLDRAAPNPEVLKHAKLSFGQVLQLSRAFNTRRRPDYWVWKAISDLNKLRNLLAHNLDPANLDMKTQEYLSYVQANLAAPIPEHSGQLSQTNSFLRANSGSDFSYFDMVTVVLYDNVLDVLGFISHAELEAAGTDPRLKRTI